MPAKRSSHYCISTYIHTATPQMKIPLERLTGIISTTIVFIYVTSADSFIVIAGLPNAGPQPIVLTVSLSILIRMPSDSLGVEWVDVSLFAESLRFPFEFHACVRGLQLYWLKWEWIIYTFLVGLVLGASFCAVNEDYDLRVAYENFCKNLDFSHARVANRSRLETLYLIDHCLLLWENYPELACLWFLW